MAVPDVRFFVWFLQKTESIEFADPGGVGLRSRAAETSVDFFEIKSESTNIDITDGVGSTDDTCRIIFTEEIWNEFLLISNTKFYPVFAVTVDDRFFGPYDLETIKYSGEFKDIEIFGRIDKEFEDTVIDKFPTRLFATRLGLTSNLETLLTVTRPFNYWNQYRSGFNSRIIAEVGQEKNLSGIRGVLNKYGLSISAITFPAIGRTGASFIRDLEIYPKYPVIIDGDNPEKQTVSILYAGFANELLNTVVARPISRIVNIDNEDIWKDSVPSFDIPDFNNAPGSYNDRRIDISIKNIQVQSVLASSQSKLPRLVLDPNSQDFGAIGFIENARWQLQNSAAKGTISLNGMKNIISGQFIRVDNKHLQYPLWRIESIAHSITPDSGHSTKLGLILIQGLFNPSAVPRNTIIFNPIPDPPLAGEEGIDDSKIPEFLTQKEAQG